MVVISRVTVVVVVTGGGGSAQPINANGNASEQIFIFINLSFTSVLSASHRRNRSPTSRRVIGWARAIARELCVDLVAGSILERVAGQSKLANTSVHVNPQGEVVAAYRKIHMFDVEVAGRTYCESALEEPGEEIVLSHTAEGVELGLSICYDLRFPELYRILAVRGARIMTLPAAFTLATHPPPVPPCASPRDTAFRLELTRVMRIGSTWAAASWSGPKTRSSRSASTRSAPSAYCDAERLASPSGFIFGLPPS